MTNSPPASLAPSERLLCGPGPTNVDPVALAAMEKPILGHLDPELHELMDEVVRMLRIVYRNPEGLVLPLQATGTSGMETGLVNLTQPGDTVIVGASGYFGRRMIEIAGRAGCEVVEVMEDWGLHVPNARLLETLDDNPGATLLAVVHGETSTGSLHPLAELGAALRERPGTLLMADCVTTLGGTELDVHGWGVDYAYSCTQKCVGAPPGMSPVSVSEKALERFAARSTPVPFSFDFDLLRQYWVDRPATYHHTAPVLHIYALYEVLRELLREGAAERCARHAAAGAHLQERMREAGLELIAEPDHQLAQLSAIAVPDGVDGKAVKDALLTEHGIEVGGGLEGAPPMWRIGLMGPNATPQTADRVFDALLAVLQEQGAPVSA
ncbi:MAG TPA: alanine--glyoxylate aminotransferase family protein [Solirubrobacteraceae bacterium]|nr:alanine--glyoxylate aminotransferase family protein [Solirubrobacteraceae bacterium]